MGTALLLTGGVGIVVSMLLVVILYAISRAPAWAWERNRKKLCRGDRLSPADIRDATTPLRRPQK